MEPTQPKPVAVWNSARDVWETPGTEGFFCEHLAVFSETFPTSGMTVNGAAYALPTWEPATGDTGSSSLLLTPVASEGQKATFQQGSAQRALTGQPFLTNQIRDIYDLNQPAQTSSKATTGDSPTTRLLPTPEAKLGSSGPDYAKASRGSGGNDLQTTVALHLLPTPSACVANDGEGTETWLARRERVKLTAANGNGMGMPLTIASLLIGASTNPPSAAGNGSLGGQLPDQLTLLDAMADTD